MVDKVKCGNKVCKLFDVVCRSPISYINKVAPLDGRGRVLSVATR